MRFAQWNTKAYSLFPVKFVAEATGCCPTKIVVLANERPTPRKAKQQRPSLILPVSSHPPGLHSQKKIPPSLHAARDAPSLLRFAYPLGQRPLPPRRVAPPLRLLLQAASPLHFTSSSGPRGRRRARGSKSSRPRPDSGVIGIPFPNLESLTSGGGIGRPAGPWVGSYLWLLPLRRLAPPACPLHRAICHRSPYLPVDQEARAPAPPAASRRPLEQAKVEHAAPYSTRLGLLPASPRL